MKQPHRLVLGLIVANEFCERYCFYGFRSLLFLFCRQVFKRSEGTSTEIVHFFICSCYLFTFFGGLISDAILGRYKTILFMSILYLFGTILTTISAITFNFYALAIGLLLISIGTGGIKPCVSTFGGDQFQNADDKIMKTFFDIFYFSINAGSLISIFISPIIAEMSCYGQNTCYPVAFGIPVILLAISLALFCAGNSYYVKKRPDSTLYRLLFFQLFTFFFHKICKMKSKTIENISKKLFSMDFNAKKKFEIQKNFKELNAHDSNCETYEISKNDTSKNHRISKKNPSNIDINEKKYNNSNDYIKEYHKDNEKMIHKAPIYKKKNDIKNFIVYKDNDPIKTVAEVNYYFYDNESIREKNSNKYENLKIQKNRSKYYIFDENTNIQKDDYKCNNLLSNKLLSPYEKSKPFYKDIFDVKNISSNDQKISKSLYVKGNENFSQEFSTNSLNKARIQTYYDEYKFKENFKNNSKEGLELNEDELIKKDIKKAVEILKVFVYIPFFWMLYDQQSTTWIEQGTKMNDEIQIFNFRFFFRPEQMQALNGVLILFFIPLFSKLIYPFFIKRGYNLSSTTKMCIGMILASLSFFLAAFLESFIDFNLSILWQTPQYILLTAGEIMLSLTGMEYVYSEAPDKLKGLLLSGWLITVAIGNFYVVVFTSLNVFNYMSIFDPNVGNYIMYALIGFAAAYFFNKQTIKKSLRDY